MGCRAAAREEEAERLWEEGKLRQRPEHLGPDDGSGGRRRSSGFIGNMRRTEVMRRMQHRANEIDIMTQQQSLKHALDRFDVDGDGVLSRPEFDAWVLETFPRVVGKEDAALASTADALMAAVDKDGDGAVGVNELRAFFRVFDPNRGSVRPPLPVANARAQCPPLPVANARAQCTRPLRARPMHTPNAHDQCQCIEPPGLPTVHARCRSSRPSSSSTCRTTL